MKRCPLAFLMIAALAAGVVNASAQASAKFRPAMIGQGVGSVAAELHYPPKESAAKREAAVTFYCEVKANGKPAHVGIVCASELSRFREAVDRAFARGRFVPAAVDGQPVPVSIGGTIFFFAKDRPTIAVSLATADRNKVASLQNYIQPQMIGSNAEFRRKIFRGRDGIVFQSSPNPGAEVLAQVDAEGNLIGKKLLRENPPNGGFGTALLKGFEGAKFVPAFDNGRAVAGEFNLPFNFKEMRDPDGGAPAGSILPPEQ